MPLQDLVQDGSVADTAQSQTKQTPPVWCRRQVPADMRALNTGARHPPGRRTTLITPSSLSRNFWYISGASSNDVVWVTTKLGAILPASIISSRGLV